MEKSCREFDDSKVRVLRLPLHKVGDLVGCSCAKAFLLVDLSVPKSGGREVWLRQTRWGRMMLRRDASGVYERVTYGVSDFAQAS